VKQVFADEEPETGRNVGALTTLGVGGLARRLVFAQTDAALVAEAERASERGEPLFVLGGGSNVVVADEGFDGTVLAVRTRGIRLERVSGPGDDAEQVRVEAAAGEPWTDLVSRCVGEGLAGLECLAGIPGTVGAAPIQNVGAYGAEVADTLISVRAWDLYVHAIVDLPASSCNFRYRASLFKDLASSGPVRPRFVVLGVVLGLRHGPSAPIRYAELHRSIGHTDAELSPRQVADAVLRLRRSKSMVLDPSDPDSRSVGSFFTNPVVDVEVADRVDRVAGSAGPRWPVPGFPGRPGVKLAAAWLVERAGMLRGLDWSLPGQPCRVGLSRSHALAIVNRGDARASDIVELAREVRSRVFGRFGVVLEPEPVFVGFVGDPLGTLP
jgi:UDP-N-acetylmuramate dehydrogenase